MAVSMGTKVDTDNVFAVLPSGMVATMVKLIDVCLLCTPTRAAERGGAKGL